MAQLSPEHRLLLAAALFPLQDDEIVRLRGLCQAHPDWSLLLELADRHHLAPLLHANLQRHAADLVSPEALDILKAHAEQNRQSVLGLMGELNTISTILSPAGIILCVLKGPPLSQLLYGEMGMRVTTDLDLLLDEARLAEAESLLQQAGYRRVSPPVRITPLQWRVYRRIRHHVNYTHPKRGVHIEIHWTLTTAELFPQSATRQFLERAQPLPNSALTSLAEQDLFCYLIVHGARHGWEQFKWLADIAMFLRKSPGPDWLAVQEQMAALDLLRPLGQALLLVQDLFGIPVPDPLASLIEERPVQRLAQHAMKISLLQQGFGEGQGHFRRWHALRYRSGLKASWRFKIAEISQLWVVENDWVDLSLPDWLFPLYLVLRPFLWLRRYHLPRR